MKLKIDYLFKSSLMLLLMLGMTSLAVAQSTIKGTLTDADGGEPLIGANVLVVGTSSGTITDFDGTYSVSVPAGATQLEFSYTGYQSQTVDINGQTKIDLALSSGTLLDEVVVVGYGTATQKEVTSSVASVKAEDFNGGNVNDPTQLIQGKVAGLSISDVGSDPNGSTTIRLRGINSLGNTSPLIIIDGVIGASLETVDPNDIASIDVLKDGSAAAIYGSRASAGVILVTTKKGTTGRTDVTYNGLVTTESVGRTLPLASAQEYVRLRGADQDLGSDTDWLDEVTESALSFTHNLALSGGINKTTYRASLNLRDIEGVGINSGFNQLNGRLNLSQKALNDRLTVALNVSATERKAQFGFAEAFRYANTYNPTAPIFNEAQPEFGGFFQSPNFDYFNPVAIAQQGINEGIQKDLLLSINGQYELVDGLTAGVSYAATRESDLNGEYYPNNAYFRGTDQNGEARRFSEDRNTELFEMTGNYDKTFGDLDFGALIGYSYQDITKENFGANARDFIANGPTYNNLGLGIRAGGGDTDAVFSNKENYKVIGFFGRVNLAYDDTYYLSASVRREGSSRFGENNQWGLFPAVSAGVTLSNLLDVSGLDNLKLRAGYGETGSLPPFSYLSKQQYNSQGNTYPINGANVTAVGITQDANPDLKWETKGEFNVGLDFAFADYKFTGSIDYYNRNTRDLIYNVQASVPPFVNPNIWANLEDVDLVSNGVELVLGYNMDNGSGFSWSPNVVFSTYNTELQLTGATDAAFSFFSSADATQYPVGSSPGAPGLNDTPIIQIQGDGEIGNIWGPVFAGIDDNGGYIFEDLDGDGAVEVGNFAEDDNRILGNGLPDFSLGINNTFKFGNLDVNFFLRGDFGHELVNMYRLFYENNSPSRRIDNVVQTEFFDERLTAAPKFSSRYVETASYLALDNITVGYNFDVKDGGNFNKIRVFVAGRNLAFFTNYTGIDPSVRYADEGALDNGGRRDFSFDPLLPGLDRRNTYFRTYQLNLGVNLGF